MFQVGDPARAGGRPSKITSKQFKGGQVSLEKSQELAKVQGAIDLLKTHQGECLMRPAIRLLLLMELQLYYEAMKTTSGAIGKIPMEARVYGLAASLVHVSHHTTKTIMDEFLTSHKYARPTEKSMALLLDNLSIQDSRRGPAPLPNRTRYLTSSHVLEIGNFIMKRLGAGQCTHLRDIRDMLRNFPDDPADVSKDVLRRVLKHANFGFYARQGLRRRTL